MSSEYTRVAPSVHIIGDRRFVAGLYWQALTKPRAPLAEARSIGKREGKDVVSIRRAETVVQAGFMARGSHNVKGLYSLATVLAQSISARLNADNGGRKGKQGKYGATFLSAFRLNETQYAMLAVKGGGILADSDMVGDLETIRDNLSNFFSLIDDPECPVFAPPECAFGGTELPIADLVANPRREHLLKPLSRMPSRGEMINGGLALAIAVVAALFAYDWYAEREAQKAAQAAAAAAELRRLAAESGKATPAQALVKPWVRAPAVAQFARVCEAAIRQFPLSMGGWLLQRASCGVQGANAEYSRQAGLTVFQFHTAVQAWNQDARRSVRPDGNQAGVTLSVPLSAAGDEPLRRMDDVREGLLSHFQFKYISVTVSPKESVATTLPGADPKAEQNLPDWKTLTFTTASGQNPATALAGLDGANLRLLRMLVERESGSGKSSNLKWVLEGEMYGN
ncbi:type 4b pilus protein PilO2 [Achromobacter insuavis]|uniref:type 4b pilus protein PilO2 n=1 Tax=Achromobacter insuavis TaxID=1287735 RepID=UPI001F135FE3|nr:type 4b pilus protein PilO2 [Achromobacter insuavis]